jgi:hypothetical protein
LTSALTGGSIIEVARFELPSFTVTLKGVAQWFGFELSKLIVDEVFEPLVRETVGDAKTDNKPRF